MLLLEESWARTSPSVHKSKFHGAFVPNRRVDLSTPLTRCLLDSVTVPVPHRSPELARPRWRREMTL